MSRKSDKDGYKSEVSGKIGGQWVSDTALLTSGEEEEAF